MKFASFLVLVFAILTFSAKFVSAQTSTPSATVSASPSVSVTRTPSNGVTRRPSMSPRPTGANFCESHKEALLQRSNNLTRMADNLLAKFTNTTMRVDEFYKNKVVPRGKTINNYETLMSTIETNKAKVKTALDKAKVDVAGFTCASNPRRSMTTFRTDMMAVVAALKAYKTSVRNLIVAVHSVTPADANTTGTGTISPTRTMSVTPTHGVTLTITPTI